MSKTRPMTQRERRVTVAFVMLFITFVLLALHGFIAVTKPGHLDLRTSVVVSVIAYAGGAFIAARSIRAGVAE